MHERKSEWDVEIKRTSKICTSNTFQSERFPFSWAGRAMQAQMKSMKSLVFFMHLFFSAAKLAGMGRGYKKVRCTSVFSKLLYINRKAKTGDVHRTSEGGKRITHPYPSFH